jgi:hypothetical protein
VEGREGQEPAGHLEERAEQLPHEGDSYERVRDGRTRARRERERERAGGKEQECRRQGVRAGPQHLGEGDVGALGRGTDPGQRTGRECDDAGRHRSEEQPAREPGAAPGGQREERLEPLLGLFSPKRRDLRCADEAHREEEEHEGRTRASRPK